jgi:hypothetical protein
VLGPPEPVVGNTVGRTRGFSMGFVNEGSAIRNGTVDPADGPTAEAS